MNHIVRQVPLEGRTYIPAPHAPQPGTVVTAAGDRLDSPVWDFASEAHTGSNACALRWDVPVVVDGLELGFLTDRRWEWLLNPVREAIFVRWKDADRDHGQAWRSGATAYNMAFIIREFLLDMAARGVTDINEVTDGILRDWARKAAERRDIAPFNRRRRVSAALIPWAVRGRITRSYTLESQSLDPADWMPEGCAEDQVLGSQGYPTLPKPILDAVVGAALEVMEDHGEALLALRAYLGNGTKKARATALAQELGDAPEGRDFGILGRVQRMRDLLRAETHLQTACYIVIAFLSGARVSEMIRLEVGCCRPAPAGRAPAERWRLHGVIVKDRQVPEEHVWHVTKEVGVACALMERMHSATRETTGVRALFLTTTGGRSAKKGDAFEANASWNRRLKSFVTLARAPFHDGRPWPLANHQLRVSLVQWLVQEPYGTVGGSAQIGHRVKASSLRATVFEGYNRRDIQFASLLEAFEREERDRRDALIAAEPILQGRGGREIADRRSPSERARLERDVLPLIQARVEDGPARKAAAKHRKVGRPVFQSPTALCLFRPEQAMCLSGVPMADRQHPRPHLCQPLSCGNGVITRLQIPAFLEPAEAYAAELSGQGASPGQRDTAEQELERLRENLVSFLPILEAEATKLAAMLTGQPDTEARTVLLKSRLTTVDDQINRIGRLYPNG